MNPELEQWNRWNESGGPAYPHDQVVRFLLRRYSTREQRIRLHVLDLGCGGGVHTEFLAREGFFAHGYDVSPVAIEKTRARLRKAGFEAASLRICSVDSIDATDEQFDAVICIGVLECAGVSRLAPAFGEILRVLRPGGACLALFASQHDFRVVVEKSPIIHGFTDEEVTVAIASLSDRKCRIWRDRLIATYYNGKQQQNEHLLTLIKEPL